MKSLNPWIVKLCIPKDGAKKLNELVVTINFQGEYHGRFMD